MPDPVESIGFSGKGGSVSISVDGGTTFVVINGVKDYKPSASKTSYATITNLSSPGNNDEFLPLTTNNGTPTITLVVNPLDSGQTMTFAAFESQVKCKFNVQYPKVGDQTTGMLDAFSAYVSAAPRPSLGVSDASTSDVELTVTGPITTTPGTTS